MAFYEGGAVYGGEERGEVGEDGVGCLIESVCREVLDCRESEALSTLLEVKVDETAREIAVK